MAAKSNHTVASRTEAEPLGTAGQSAAGRRINPSPTRQWITDQVRRMYNDVVNEPLPDAFNDLLTKLDAEAPKAPTGSNATEKAMREPGN